MIRTVTRRPESRNRPEGNLLFICIVIALLVIGANRCVLTLHRSVGLSLMRGDVLSASKFEHIHISSDTRIINLALSMAINREDKNCVEYILSKEHGVSLSDALYAAVEANSPEMVQSILAHGANPNGVNCGHNSALFTSAMNGLYPRVQPRIERSSEMVRMLSGAGAHCSLYEAIVCCDRADLKLRLEQGADPNGLTDTGRTMLASAYIYLGKPSVFAGDSLFPCQARFQSIQTLHEHGAYCTLHEAAYFGLKDEIVRSLAHGADPNARLLGRPVLFDAAARGNIEVVRLLLDSGAYIDARTNTGNTILNAARSSGKPELVSLLIARGAADHSYKLQETADSKKRGPARVVSLFDSR